MYTRTWSTRLCVHAVSEGGCRNSSPSNNCPRNGFAARPASFLRAPAEKGTHLASQPVRLSPRPTSGRARRRPSPLSRVLRARRFPRRHRFVTPPPASSPPASSTRSAAPPRRARAGGRSRDTWRADATRRHTTSLLTHCRLAPTRHPPPLLSRFASPPPRRPPPSLAPRGPLACGGACAVRSSGVARSVQMDMLSHAPASAPDDRHQHRCMATPRVPPLLSSTLCRSERPTRATVASPPSLPHCPSAAPLLSTPSRPPPPFPASPALLRHRTRLFRGPPVPPMFSSIFSSPLLLLLLLLLLLFLSSSPVAALRWAGRGVGRRRAFPAVRLLQVSYEPI